MRKLRLLLCLAFLMTIIAGCGEKEQEPEFLEVDLTINPEKAEVNEPVTFEAKVTYGGKPVKDADEVTFEIWRAHDEKHEKITVEHTKDGIYKLEQSFTREGTYYVFSHVTARDMHNMPKREFVIGEPSEPETDSGSMHMGEHNEHGDHDKDGEQHEQNEHGDKDKD